MHLAGLGAAFFALLALSLSAAAAPSPRHAPKAVVVNEDGHGGFYAGRYTSAESIRQKILGYRDTQLAVFEWCVTAGSRTNFPSRVTEIIGEGMTEYPRRGDKLACEVLHQLAAQGVDTLAVVCSACREVGLPCYASVRMNGDYPASWMGEGIPRMFNSNFWWQHPELRLRGRQGEDLTKLSYAYPQVRQWRLRFLRELAAHDIDGINMDFLRHPDFLGYDEPLLAEFQRRYGQDPRALPADDPRWLDLRAEVMTDFVRSVRKLLDEAGARKGRRLGLSARVDWREYRQWGCDIARWMKEGLLDYLVLAQHTLGGYEFDLRPFVRMARGTGCAIYFGEEACVSGHDLTPEEDQAAAAGKAPPPVDTLTLQQYVSRARRWYQMGADGVHLFNDENNLPVLRVLGDPARFPKQP